MILDIKLLKHFEMQEITFQPYITIQDKSFGKAKIVLRADDFKNVDFQDGTTMINYNNCSFDRLVIENTTDIDIEHISIHFINCVIKDVEIRDVVAKNVSVSFSSCILSGRIVNDQITAVDCNNCILTKSLHIIGPGRTRISYSKENLDTQFFTSKIMGLDDGSWALQNVQSYGLDRIKQIQFVSNFDFLLDGLRMYISLSLNFDPTIEDKFANISDVKLASLSISGSSNGKISIENSSINSLYIRKFSTKGELQLFNIMPLSKVNDESKLEIHQCNLDNTWFSNFDFIHYNKISFYRTKFSNTIFTSCILPDNYNSFGKFHVVENIHYTNEEQYVNGLDRYEMFLQLRKAFEATGNYYEAQKLQATAHQALSEIRMVSGWDRFILRVNNVSNNHGLSIKKPFLWLLGISITLYLLYLIDIDRINFGNDFDFNLVGYYFQFIDLTHRADFLTKEPLNGWAMTLDFANKVLTGFFIYQFIAAFRKYGKT